MWSILFGLTIGISMANVRNLLEDIENHDEFNLADVDGIGFDLLESEIRRRNLPIPPSMRK